MVGGSGETKLREERVLTDHKGLARYKRMKICMYIAASAAASCWRVAMLGKFLSARGRRPDQIGHSRHGHNSIDAPFSGRRLLPFALFLVTNRALFREMCPSPERSAGAFQLS